MTTLAHKLRLTDYFALAFGTMVGVGWLVLMDDWLGRGGPVGAILGFALGGILLLPVGYVYGQWVQRIPDAAGEAAYTAEVFPPIVSYFTGWMRVSGVRRAPANFHPACPATPCVSIGLALQIEPYIMTGLESVPKVGE